MLKGKLLNGLYDIYTMTPDIDSSWIQQNSWVLNNARRNAISIGGSIALAIGGRHAFKTPGDIDLFTNSPLDATGFISDTLSFLADTKYGNYFNLMVNNKTSRCLPGVISHYRLIVPFWKPICLMVLQNEFPYYYYHGLRVQNFNFVKDRAMEVSLIDNKDRLSKVPNISGTGSNKPVPVEYYDLDDIDEFDLIDNMWSVKSDDKLVT